MRMSGAGLLDTTTNTYSWVETNTYLVPYAGTKYDLTTGAATDAQMLRVIVKVMRNSSPGRIDSTIPRTPPLLQLTSLPTRWRFV